MNEYDSIVEAATGDRYRPGNQLTILQDGGEIFPAMLEAIRAAEVSIEFVTYVYWHSATATQFADALAERARAGVRVRLLIDAIGGAIMSSRTVWQLERAGVTVAWFRPAMLRNLGKLNRRTHRKILIVDGQIGFTGGVGIADQWATQVKDAGNWRETHCRISGPACADLYDSFAQNWTEAARGRLAHRPPSPAAGDVAILTTSSTQRRGGSMIENLVFAAIDAAKTQLWITTAYFVPSDVLIDKLVAAAGRGVDVRLLTNGPRTNHRFTRHAGRACYEPLLAGGVKLYEYQPRVLHTKLITVDGAWATLGSTNLDARSLVINDELNVSFSDVTIIAQLNATFERDLADAQQITRGDWAKLSGTERFLQGVVKVFRAQL